MFYNFFLFQGTFWGLMIGLVLGLTRMVLSFVYEGPGCDQPDTRPAFLSQIHYLHFAIILSFLKAFENKFSQSNGFISVFCLHKFNKSVIGSVF